MNVAPAALAALLLMTSGCGSLSRLVGDDARQARATRAPGGQTGPRLLATYLVRVDPREGTMQFTPLPTSGAGEASGSRGRPLSERPRGVRLQATNYGPVDQITISGSASHSGGELSGNVSISTTNRVSFADVKAVIASISSSSVSVKNASGTTTLTGSSRPFYDHGQVAVGAPSARTWTFINPSAVSFTFRVQLFANVWNYAPGDGGPVGGIYFLTSTTGWAVGGGGKIFKTTDGGASWQPQNAAITRGLNDIFFLDANRGWAVGEAGTILATTNGGRTWQKQTSPVSVNLNAVRFLNASRGWIAGNIDNQAGLATLLETSDGGASWAQRGAILPEIAHLIGLDLTTDGGARLTAVGVGDLGAVILRSTDGGASWNAQSLPGDLDPLVSLQDVAFVSASRGWAVGTFGTILFTDNGGATWTRQPTPVGSANLYDVAFASASVGWCVGQGGSILKTTNGGASWSSQSSGIGTDLQGVAALVGDTQRAWASGAAGALLLTTNGGSTWSAPSAAASVAYNAVKFVDTNTGCVVGAAGTVLRTTNAGSTWSRVAAGSPPVTATLTDVDFASATHGWIVGAMRTVLKTTNGGTGWSAVELPSALTQGAFNGVKFVSTSTGWIVGNGTHGTTSGGVPFNTGLYMRTTDGGATWSVRPTAAEGALPSLNAVDFADANTGWIVGSTGYIQKTTNGGTSWSVQASPSGQALLAVKAIDAARACAVGQGGRIIRTNDGANWFEQFSGVTSDLNGVEFVDANRGWIVGNNGLVLRTTDGGASWTLVDAYSNSRLNGVCFLGPDDGWIVGANGLIKRYY